MKDVEKKQRLTLTLIFSFAVFCILFLTVLLADVAILLLAHFGVLSGDRKGFLETTFFLLIWITCTSLVIGPIITFFLGKIPLKPLSVLITGLNRLAAGKYDTRIHFGKCSRRYPAARELTTSFNRLAEELESTEMLRSDFINNFSHEFKTPIVSIAGFAKLLQRGNLSDIQRDEYLRAIEEESLRLSYMATNVLNLTKVENQTILTDVTTFNLSEQLRDCVLLLEAKWSRRNLKFQMDFGEHMIAANEELLKQVWINLIDNAVKFSAEGSTIEISVKEDARTAMVGVINPGIEIPEEQQGRIFNKFYQADQSHAAEGNGIGLAIVRRIVDLHQGEIGVHSGNGLTMFTVTLPLEP